MYIHESIDRLYNYYKPIIYDPKILTINNQLEQFATYLLKAYQNRDELALLEISNYHPDFIGVKSFAAIDRTLEPEDILITIARCYHFNHWSAVEAQTEPINKLFEEAVEAVVFGNFDKLQALLNIHPSLVNQRSQYGHRAGLIHYIGSNGVEIWRQRVPDNIVSIANLLLDRGADPHMDCALYGGTQGVLGLIETSAHPADAGLKIDLLQLITSQIS